MAKFLKPGGVILINEPETSFMLKFLQIILDDESWSLTDKVFQKNKISLVQKTHGFQIPLLHNFYLKRVKIQKLFSAI